MAQSTIRQYHSVPKWREERERLVREVHGGFSEIGEIEPEHNKVSSREKAIKRNLKTWVQLDDQMFNDFWLGCNGFNSVSFKYNEEQLAWKFDDENYKLSDKTNGNNNIKSFFNEYNKFAADLLTKIHTIRRFTNQFEGNYQLGRCVAILVDEVNRFMEKDFKKRLQKLRGRQDTSKTILQSIHLAFTDPIEQLETFMFNVVKFCAVGGFLLNLIKKELDSSDKCYQTFFHEILTRSYCRGMEFYAELVVDWLNGNNLDNDPFFEFFIWDASKQRCSNALNKKDVTLMELEESILLQSVDMIKFYNPIDVKSFKTQHLIVPELCPHDFDEELRNGIVKIGLYNHVLMLENRDFFNSEFSAIPIPYLSFENLYKLPKLVKERHRLSGRVVLRHLCNQLEFAILMEKLPAYFCGIQNSIIDDFVDLTENFDWSAVSAQKNTRLTQINMLYQRAIKQSPLADDPLANMILLEFSVIGQVDVSHPPMASLSTSDRPLADLELTVRCKDSFGMAFPPTVFELYRNLFRLRHTLRRTFMLLKRKFFAYRHELSRVEFNALSIMIQFVHGYDNFVFGYKAPKLIQEYFELVRNGLKKETLDLDTFLREQEQMIGKVHGVAFVSSNVESFANPMWAILNRLERYARGESDFESTCIDISRFSKKIKRYLDVQQEKGDCHVNYANFMTLLLLSVKIDEHK
ncbi:hypothetical protein M3Y97_00096900 [Aphelenchoides bicaudatus]|nr:hypothetical protein M3Y97_00096900 [Aphelenchoides bicaudatus]